MRMNTYVRLSDGRIVDTTDWKAKKVSDKDRGQEIILYHGKKRVAFNTKDIVLQDDYVTSLIMKGDLTDFGFITQVDYSTGLFSCSGYKHPIPFICISKLYFKKGNNYILVWSKDKGII